MLSPARINSRSKLREPNDNIDNYAEFFKSIFPQIVTRQGLIVGRNHGRCRDPQKATRDVVSNLERMYVQNYK